MELKEREGKYGFKILYYDNVEPELLQFEEFDKEVLPAPYYYDKKLVFKFRKRHEPGTKMWPSGGYELKGPGGEFRAFDLDQIIIHPNVSARAKMAEKVKKRQEKEAIRKEKKLAKMYREENKRNKIKGKRGRPKLSDEQKQEQQLERKLNPIDGPKRGRKRLTDEERIKREAEKLVKKMTGTGKRGRPADPARKAKKEIEKLERHKRSGGKKGRPKTKK